MHYDIYSNKYDIAPFLDNGIYIIDTCIMRVFIDGFAKSHFSKKNDDQEYNDLIFLFQKFEINNDWDKFYITPHLFTEICRYLSQKDDRNKKHEWGNIVEIIVPLLKTMGEIKNIDKNKILELINKNKPKLEIGDLSIFLVAEEYLKKNEKIVVISKDKGVITKCEEYPNVLAINFKETILNLKYNQ